MASHRDTFDRLAKIGTVVERKRWLGFLPNRRYVVIALTPAAQGALDSLLATINIEADLIEHHVYHDEDLVMCSYDNLACCWLTKAISLEPLQDAARTRGFRFSDAEAF
jgi:hypothetical protein